MIQIVGGIAAGAAAMMLAPSIMSAIAPVVKPVIKTLIKGGLLARRQYHARRGFGFFGNLIVGMAGAFLGGFLLNALGIVSGSRVNPESYHFVSKGNL